VKVEAREATNEELCSVHTQNDVEPMKAVSSKSYGKHQCKAKHWQVLMIQSSSTTVPPSRPFWLLDQSFEVVIHPCVFLSVGHCFSHLLRLFTVTKSWNLGILL
jgi:hypothetical protein